MVPYLKKRAIAYLRSLEQITGTDMVYLGRSGFWGNFGLVIVSFLALGLYVVYANFLTPYEFGIYQYFLSLSIVISAFTLTGMNSAVTRSVARGYDGALHQALRAQAQWAILPVSVGIVIASYYLYNGNTTFAVAGLVMGLVLPISNALTSYSAFLLGKQDFRRSFFYNLLINLPYYGSMALAAVVFHSAIVVLVVNCFVNTIALFGAYVATRKVYAPKDEPDPELPSYARHLSTMNMPGMLLSQIDVFLTFYLLGPVSLAIYSFATALPDQLARFLKFIPGAALPKFSRASHVDLQRTLGRKLVIIGVLSLIGAALYALVASYIYQLLFPQYHEAAIYSQVYAITMIGLVTTIVTTALVAHKRTRDLYIYNLLLPLFQTSALTYGIFFYGLWGLVIAKVTITVFALCCALFLFFRPIDRE